MLISRRKEGDTLKIGDGIEIRLISVRKKKVIVGVVAPRDVKVVTGKLSPVALATAMSAIDSAKLDQLLQPAKHAPAEAPVVLLGGSSSRNSFENEASVTDKPKGHQP